MLADVAALTDHVFGFAIISMVNNILKEAMHCFVDVKNIISENNGIVP